MGKADNAILCVILYNSKVDFLGDLLSGPKDSSKKWSQNTLIKSSRVVMSVLSPRGPLLQRQLLPEYVNLLWLLKKIFLIFIFNWRIIALQYCIGFCHTPM